MDEFDVLRRQATKLERHLEDCVARYQQLAQGVPTSNGSNSSNSLLTSSTNSSSALPSLAEETALRNETSRVLRELQELISQQLSPAAEASGKQQHVLLVKRYREILFDLSGDFHKASSTLQRKREMAQIMEHAAQQNQNNNISSGNSDMDHLLRERNHIDNSLTASSAVLSQASDIRSDLKSQGLSLKNSVSGKMMQIQTNMPTVNKLMESISKKRSRDDYILAGVIASCILFTLWYLFG